TTRRWTLVTWLFQGTGVMLGAAWAYHVLGWGGYWGWDPVENASLLPWLSGTAFLHSVMMQEKKGMMKVWNIVLVSATFFLCILGTFLTRSGVVQSVHAFARSEIGKYFVSFMAIGIAATAYLILDRLKYLKSESELESVISRESSFQFGRSEEHTSELQSPCNLVCRLLLDKKKTTAHSCARTAISREVSLQGARLGSRS